MAHNITFGQWMIIIYNSHGINNKSYDKILPCVSIHLVVILSLNNYNLKVTNIFCFLFFFNLVI